MTAPSRRSQPFHDAQFEIERPDEGLPDGVINLFADLLIDLLETRTVGKNMSTDDEGS